MDLGVSGLASGFDWRAVVEQLADVERTPQARLRAEQNQIQQRSNAYGSIKTQMLVLQSRVKALQNEELFSSRMGKSSDVSIATVETEPGAAVGSYLIGVSQKATSSVYVGASDAGAGLSATNDVSGIIMGSANFGSEFKPGTFAVNGKVISVGESDTLQSVFDQITTSTGGAVSATYDATSDKITLQGTGEVVLGSAADTSNFLVLARLKNNGTSSVSSAVSLGSVKTSAAMSAANLRVPPTDGGSGAGTFKINGVEITYSVSADKLSDILQRISNSSAGVNATYDSVNDRFLLSNKVTGDLGVAMEDVTGNFLAATGLSSGALTRGKDLEYTVNGGPTLTSHSNTIDDSSSGISGLVVTVLEEGNATVSVSPDTAKIKGAIADFLTELNKVQSVIDSQTVSTTDAKGKVTASPLSGDQDAYELAARLRSLSFSYVGGLSGSLNHLSDLGYETSGNDNAITLKDETKLESALSDDLSSFQELFNNSTDGIATRIQDFLERTVGEEGSLVDKTETFLKQVSGIDTQIADQERLVQQNRARLIAGFVAMEQAQAKTNQQMQFLNQRFG